MSEAIEFGAMADADRFREEYAEFLCPIDDDRRERTVHFTSDTPEHVLEEARAVATSGKAEREASEASGGTRELTESEKRTLDFSRDGVSYVKAKALANLADEYGVNAFEHVDPSEVDGADDARPIFERARRSGGTGRGGGTAQYDDEASERADRQRRMRAERAEAERCDHARDKCRAGEPEACEILQTRCGLSEAEASRLLSEREPAGTDAPEADDSEPWIPSEKWDDLSGREKGAVANAAGGYHGAVDALREAVSEAERAFKNAQAAAKALNGLRAGVGAGPLHFSALEEANAALLDMVRMTAAYCHECHATHEEHDHDVTSGEREDLRAFVRSGASGTPVGTAEEFGPAREAAEHPDAALAERAPERSEPAGTSPAKPADPPGLSERPAYDPPERSGVKAERVESSERGESETEEFASERQRTLTGDRADSEDTQFTLTGDDASKAANRAVPEAWTPRPGGTYLGGPYRVDVAQYDGESYKVVLTGSDESQIVARGVPSEETARDISREFAQRVKPPEVSFHSADAAVPEAAAAAKAAVEFDAPDGQGVISSFGGS